MLVALATSETNGYYRKWLKFSVPLTIMSVLATRSRSGFLSTIAATFVLVWRSKTAWGTRADGARGGPRAHPLSNTGTFERLSTLRNVEQDGSAMGSLTAWKVAQADDPGPARDGHGPQPVRANYRLRCQVIGQKGGTRVAHNAYLQIWAESNTPAFAVCSC